MIDVIALVLTGVGIIISVLYYTSVLQNTQKLQKYQMSQGFIEILGDDGVDLWYILYNLEWEDYDDFMDRYSWNNNPEMWSKISRYWQLCDQYGHQLKLGIIDLETFYDAGTGGFAVMWYKYEPIIKEMRKRNKRTPVEHRWWEYLVKEMAKESDRRGDNFFGLKQQS